MTTRVDPPVLDWTSVGPPDLADLAALVAAIEAVDQPKERVGSDQLGDFLAESGVSPARDTLLGRDRDGTARAYAWNRPQESDQAMRRVLLIGGVHPQWRRRGLGHHLLRWQLDAGRRWYLATPNPAGGPLRHLLRVDGNQADLAALCEDVGLPASRWFAYLTQPLTTPPPDPAPVAGVSIEALTPNLWEEARSANNEAFADAWGMQPIDPQPWAEQLAASTCRPEWSVVAVDRSTGAVVGYAINAAYVSEWGPQGFSEGQTDRLGVRRSWRKRGVASALLQRSMQLFPAAGLEAAGLGVDSDSPTGAHRLYESLGYQQTATFVVHTRTETDLSG